MCGAAAAVLLGHVPEDKKETASRSQAADMDSVSVQKCGAAAASGPCQPCAYQVQPGHVQGSQGSLRS